MAKKPKAVVLGVGALRGIGGAASRRFAKEGYHVLVAGRTPQKIETVVDAIRKDGGAATAFTIDGTKEDQVTGLFDAAMADDNDSGPADLFVFNMGNNAAVDFREMTAQHLRGLLAGRLLRRLPVRPRGDAPPGAAWPRHGDLHRRVGLAARPAEVRRLQRDQGRPAPAGAGD